MISTDLVRHGIVELEMEQGSLCEGGVACGSETDSEWLGILKRLSSSKKLYV
jgi:hypothetical protein